MFVTDSIGRELPDRTPQPVDAHVGARLRLRRMAMRMTQEKLGELMGLTFQQIQKYEKGDNRIGASRLHRLAEILEVPPGWFFDDMPAELRSQPGGDGMTETLLLDFVGSRDGLELNQAFMRVTNPKWRRKIVELVRALAAE